jgi:hypothetical protein
VFECLSAFCGWSLCLCVPDVVRCDIVLLPEVTRTGILIHPHNVTEKEFYGDMCCAFGGDERANDAL